MLFSAYIRFQTLILFIELFHSRHQAGIHAAILRTPFVETCRTHPAFASQIRNRNTAFGLFQYAHDLSIAVFRFFHQHLLVYHSRKSYLQTPLLSGGLPGRHPSRIVSLAKRSVWDHRAITPIVFNVVNSATHLRRQAQLH